MSGATTALIGAAVGCAGTGGFTLWLEQRRWGREDARAARTLQAAARLVAAELRTAETLAHAAAKYDSYMILQGLESTAWDVFSGRLAEELTGEEYLTVVNAAMKVKASAVSKIIPPGVVLPNPQDLQSTTAALAEACDAGIEALEPYVGPEGLPVWVEGAPPANRSA